MIIESESFEVTKQDDEETNPFKELIVKDNDSKELSKDTFIPVELVNEEPFPRSVLELRIKVTMTTSTGNDWNSISIYW